MKLATYRKKNEYWTNATRSTSPYQAESVKAGGQGVAMMNGRNARARETNSSTSLAEVVIKDRANRRIAVGLILIAVSGSMLGQAPASGTDSKPITPVATNSPASSESVAGRLHDDHFIIGKDDLLTINVWKEPDVSRSLPVRSDGRISLPLVGEVQAAGLTPLQLEQSIVSKLRNYITEPEVTVMVQQINSEKFNILGQVARPGTYSLTVATTVLDAIAAAGGFREFAKQKGVYILRENPNGGELRIPFNYKDVIRGKKTEQNIKLHPRDTVVVP
jgi:polysaccharide export outer membrane protein